jgi:O-antigen/teichoic acid export membrane protein
MPVVSQRSRPPLTDPDPVLRLMGAVSAGFYAMSNEIETETFRREPLPDSPGMVEDSSERTPLLERSEITSRATRGAVSIMARGFGIRVIGMLGNILLARMLLPRDFGIISLGNTIVTFGAFIASGGLAAALVREPGKVARCDLQVVFGFQLAMTTLVAAGVTVIGSPLGQAGAVAAIMTWSLVIDSGRAANAIPLEREMAYRLVLQAEIVEVIAWNAFAVVAVLAGFGVWGVAVAQIVRALTGYFCLTLRGPTGFLLPRWNWGRTRQLLSLGFQFQGLQVVILIRDQGMAIMIAAIGGFTALGVWNIVYRFTTVVIILMESLWRVSFPAMSRLRETGENPIPVVEKAASMASVISGLLVVPLAGSAPALVPVLFGPHWTPAVRVLPLAACSVMLAGPISSIAVGYLLSENRAGVLLRMAVFDGLATWAVGLPLLATVGVIGVGVGQIASGLVDLVFLTVAVWQRRWSHGFSVTLIPLAAVVAASLPAWAMATSLGKGIAALVVSVVVGELLYLAIVLVCRGTVLDDAVRLGRRTFRSFAHAT